MDQIEIGRRIREARLQRQLTLTDVAQQIGVTASTIQRYEAGTISKVKLPVLEAIARVLQVNPKWILCETEDPAPVLPATQQPASDPAKELPEIYLHLLQGAREMELDEHDINILLGLARTLKEQKRPD